MQHADDEADQDEADQDEADQDEADRDEDGRHEVCPRCGSLATHEEFQPCGDSRIPNRVAFLAGKTAILVRGVWALLETIPMVTAKWTLSDF